MFAIFLQLFFNIQRQRIIIKLKHLDMVYLVRGLLSFKTLAITKAIATIAQIGALGAAANATRITRSEHNEHFACIEFQVVSFCHRLLVPPMPT